MSLGDNWIAEVRATVGRAGDVRAMDKRYYSVELMQLAGREVTVRIPLREGAAAQVWIGDHYQCSPQLIQDVGFADVAGAADLARDYRALRATLRQREDEERASVIRGQAKALLDLIDSRVCEARRFPRILGVLESQTLTRVLKRLSRGAGLFGLQPGQHPEEDGVVALDPGLEKAEAVLKHLHAVFGGHLHVGAPAADDGEPNPPAEDAHRLSGGGK